MELTIYPGTYHVAQATLKLTKLLLFQFPKCCNYKHEPPVFFRN